MREPWKAIVLGLGVVVSASAGAARAEPSYLVYPSTPAVFHYDTGRYVTLLPGDDNYQPIFGRRNQMLWDRSRDTVAYEVYRAPNLIGFEPSPNGLNEFVTSGNEFEVIVDGFGPAPRTVGNLWLQLMPDSPYGDVRLTVGGQPSDGFVTSLPPIEVVTPLGNGYYSDTERVSLSWTGAAGLRIVAFSDKNANHVCDGPPTFSIHAVESTVPVEQRSWGGVKALYR